MSKIRKNYTRGRCPQHGFHKVVDRFDEQKGTYYDNGTWDTRSTEQLRCGCFFDTWHYADGDVRRYRVSPEVSDSGESTWVWNGLTVK